MSNVLASLGIEQLKVLNKRIEQRRDNHTKYHSLLSDLKGVELQQENNSYFYSNFWLNCIITNNPEISKSALIDEFTKQHIEVWALWFLLYLQDYLKGSLDYGVNFGDSLFEKGLCSPLSSILTNDEFNRIGDVFNSFKK